METFPRKNHWVPCKKKKCEHEVLGRFAHSLAAHCPLNFCSECLCDFQRHWMFEGRQISQQASVQPPAEVCCLFSSSNRPAHANNVAPCLHIIYFCSTGVILGTNMLIMYKPDTAELCCIWPRPLFCCTHKLRVSPRDWVMIHKGCTPTYSPSDFLWCATWRLKSYMTIDSIRRKNNIRCKKKTLITHKHLFLMKCTVSCFGHLMLFK